MDGALGTAQMTARKLLPAAFVIQASLSGRNALAQEESRPEGGDPDRGRRIIELNCSRCRGDFGVRVEGITASRLSEIADEALERDDLRRALLDPHPEMPRVYLMTPDLDDVLDYLRALRKPRAQ